MLRPLSVDDRWKGVTNSATGVSPAISRSREGIGWVTVRLDAWRTDAKVGAVETTPVARPQPATMSDPLIATPTSTRFIDRAKDSSGQLFALCKKPKSNVVLPWLWPCPRRAHVEKAALIRCVGEALKAPAHKDADVLIRGDTDE